MCGTTQLCFLLFSRLYRLDYFNMSTTYNQMSSPYVWNATQLRCRISLRKAISVTITRLLYHSPEMLFVVRMAERFMVRQIALLTRLHHNGATKLGNIRSHSTNESMSYRRSPNSAAVKTLHLAV
jgi:hypothetical protein